MIKGKKGLLAVCLIASLFFSGCQIGNKQIVVLKSIGGRQVFKIGDISCDLKEAKLYLANYQNIYGTAYTLDLWKHDFGDESLENYIKDITLNELASVISMNQLAAETGVVLTEEEKANMKEAAECYYESLTKVERDYLELSKSELLEYYEHYALAQKMYQFFISEIDNEVSEDEARVMEVLLIFVSDAAKASEVEVRLQNGEDFTNVANAYHELSGMKYHICREDLPEEAENIIFQMEDNEISGKIAAENGYYFIKCLNKYHMELTEKNKEVILEKRKKEAFAGVYNEFLSSTVSYINEEVWENVQLNTEAEIQTDSFFKVYEEYSKVSE